VFLTFDDKPIDIPTTEEIENMANSSDVASSASPKQKAPTSSVLFVLVTRTPTSKQRAPIHSVSPKKAPSLSLNIPSHHTSPARMGSHTPRG
jgi:hypothetical protein